MESREDSQYSVFRFISRFSLTRKLQVFERGPRSHDDIHQIWADLGPIIRVGPGLRLNPFNSSDGSLPRLTHQAKLDIYKHHLVLSTITSVS
jgi:hypothetical protein